MIRLAKLARSLLGSSAAPAAGEWVRLMAKVDEPELARLRELGIPSGLLAHVNDPHERPRTERDGKVLLVVLHYPSRQGAEATLPYVTKPISVFLTPGPIVTLALEDAAFLDRVPLGSARPGHETDQARFFTALLLALAGEYLSFLEEIDGAVAALEERLRRSLRNEEVLELLRYEKSLVYFTTALKANELVLARLQKGSLLEYDAEDAERLEDVLVEFRQAIEMAEISQNILGQMMDAFASIVSNNLNAVMKVLTAATILVAVPTLIVSVYGMNVTLPGGTSRGAFAVLVGISLLATAALALVFRRRNWF